MSQSNPPITVKTSYDWSQHVARLQAKNFYYSFLLLSKEQRRAMCAVYAFMRYCDDLSDEVSDDPDEDQSPAGRAAAIERWREDLTQALRGENVPEHFVWPGFTDAVARFKIPHEYFFDMIDGVRSDLGPRHIETFDELYDYCYHVASVVGLTITHIFGFESPDALKLAEKCGVAFQLTNILRDVKEDSEKGRVYLPAEDLRRFGVNPDSFEPRDKFKQLMKFEAERARDYYKQAAPLVNMVHPHSRASLRALISIYSRLLDRIEAADFEVFGDRIRLPTWEKMWVLVRSFAG
ncbi:MAG: phytoene/squalene synthase family protein [Bryobacteraceae bacterium]